MLLLLLAGCAANFQGHWDLERFELDAGDATLVHADMGWLECDDQDACVLLRRYDIDFATLEPVPLERVWTEYGPDVSEPDNVVFYWTEGMQLQLAVGSASQTRIVLEGQGVITDPATSWSTVDATLELTR